MGNDLSGKSVASEVGERGFGHEDPISSHFEQAIKATPPKEHMQGLSGAQRSQNLQSPLPHVRQVSSSGESFRGVVHRHERRVQLSSNTGMARKWRFEPRTLRLTGRQVLHID